MGDDLRPPTLAEGKRRVEQMSFEPRKKRAAISVDVLGGSDSDFSESDEESESESEPETKAPARNADLFRNKDNSAGQMFVLIGKSERGKTHFIKWLLYEHMLREVNPVKSGLVFVRTKFKHSYKFVPDKYIIQGYEEDILRRYVENLEKIMERDGELEPSFIVFEDLVGILNNQTQWFTNFISTYRHYNISIFIAVQYLTGKHAVSPIMREQTNFAMMFNSKTFNTIENLYKNYGQLFPTKAEFQDYFFRHTEPAKVGPHVCIVYEERQDQIEHNYTPMRAPAKLPKRVKLRY